jgi:signal transduction histidine kinase
MHRSRAPSIAPGAFFVAQPWADCITNMPGLYLRQAQRMELAADLPQVSGDRVQLQQVMMNLMMNSIDAMKDVEGTRELAIKSHRTGNEQLMVCVSDSGVGLPSQQADQIFHAFFTTKPHGIGMGLAICRSIVESHSGHLWAADNSPRGASFHLILPTRAR